MPPIDARVLTDDCGRRVDVPSAPQRIACLCPSLTETLFALGLGSRMVGRTRYCIHPQPAIGEVPVLGGTKKLDFDAVAAAAPDLIIAEREENRREDVERLARDCPVYVFDIRSWDDALTHVVRLAGVCGVPERGRELGLRLAAAWRPVPRVTAQRRTLYLIWRKPWMAAGADTYIDSVMRRLGLDNVAAVLDGRYPELTSERIAALAPDLCLLSSEPFPFGDEHIDELRPLMPQARFELVDGEMFSWYGARMLPAAGYLTKLAARL